MSRRETPQRQTASVHLWPISSFFIYQAPEIEKIGVFLLFLEKQLGKPMLAHRETLTRQCIGVYAFHN